MTVLVNPEDRKCSATVRFACPEICRVVGRKTQRRVSKGVSVDHLEDDVTRFVSSSVRNAFVDRLPGIDPVGELMRVHVDVNKFRVAGAISLLSLDGHVFRRSRPVPV